MNNKVETAADLIEDRIRIAAPFYGMETASELLQEMERRPQGERRFLRFPPTKTPQIVDEETGARWEPIPVNDQDWFLGQLTMPDAQISKYFRDTTIDETKIHLIPDMFIAGDLIVSERAKNLIADLRLDCAISHH